MTVIHREVHGKGASHIMWKSEQDVLCNLQKIFFFEHYIHHMYFIHPHPPQGGRRERVAPHYVVTFSNAHPLRIQTDDYVREATSPAKTKKVQVKKVFACVLKKSSCGTEERVNLEREEGKGGGAGWTSKP